MNKKEEFVVNGKTYLMVQPCGMLTNQGDKYFLLHPYPIQPDWENEEREKRFVAVPYKQIDALVEDGSSVYPVARHIVVTNPWRIDYNDMPLIVIEKSDRNDLFETEWKGLITYELDVEEDIEPEKEFNDIHPVRDVNDVIREEEERIDNLYQNERKETEKLND